MVDMQWSERNGIVVAGLQAPHAYGVMEVKEVMSYKLVKLRNPWGQNDWHGDWSLSSPLWTHELKQLLRVSHDDEGCVLFLC